LVDLFLAEALKGEGVSHAKKLLVSSHLDEVTMHVGLEHGGTNQVCSVQLLQVVGCQELVVLIEYGVLGLLHFFGKVLKEGTPFRGTAQAWHEIGTNLLLLLRHKDET